MQVVLFFESSFNTIFNFCLITLFACNREICDAGSGLEGLHRIPRVEVSDLALPKRLREGDAQPQLHSVPQPANKSFL